VELVLRAATGLAWAIEQGNDAHIDALITEHIAALGHLGKAPGQVDTLVLGCTHYPFEVERIQAVVGPLVNIVDNGDAVARHTRRVLDAFDQLNRQTQMGTIRYEASAHQAHLERFAARQLERLPHSQTGITTL
jgi:glutamate racemase